MTLRCTRCHRQLAKPPVLVAGQAMGPKCAQAYGIRTRQPGRGRVAKADERQGELQFGAAP